MRPSSFLLLAAAALSPSLALYAPRSRHAAHVHQAALVKARNALPVPVPVPESEPEPLPLAANASVSRRVRKRQDGKCRPRPSSAAPPQSSSTTAAPINVGQHPSTTQVLSTSTSTSTSLPSSSSSSSVDAPPPSPPPPPPAPKTTAQHTSQAAPTTTKAAPPPPPPSSSSSEKPQPTQGSGGGGGGSGSVPFPGFFVGPNTGGDGTFYTPGLGACGGTNDESQLVCALPFGLFNTVPGYNGVNPNSNPVCGKFITVSANGNSVRLKVVDECAGCNNPNSVDMSPTAFQKLAPLSVGRLHDISWVWS